MTIQKMKILINNQDRKKIHYPDIRTVPFKDIKKCGIFMLPKNYLNFFLKINDDTAVDIDSGNRHVITINNPCVPLNGQLHLSIEE